jgi:hypothetical protein
VVPVSTIALEDLWRTEELFILISSISIIQNPVVLLTGIVVRSPSICDEL